MTSGMTTIASPSRMTPRAPGTFSNAVIRGLRPEAVAIAEDCTDLGKTVIREGVPLASALRLSEELGSLAFEVVVEA